VNTPAKEIHFSGKIPPGATAIYPGSKSDDIRKLIPAHFYERNYSPGLGVFSDYSVSE
jgi:hypothetical protein